MIYQSVGNKFKTITRRFCHNLSLPRTSQGKIKRGQNSVNNYLHSEEGTELVQRKSLLGPALTELDTSGKIGPEESVTNKGEIVLEII